MQIHDMADDDLEKTLRNIRLLCKQLDKYRAVEPDSYAKTYAQVCKELDLETPGDCQ